MPWPGTPKSQQSPPINPPSVRKFPSLNENSTMGDVANAVKIAFDGLTNHEQAFANIPAQIASQATAAATTVVNNIQSQTTTGVTSFNSKTGAVIYFPNLGRVNDQLGNLLYLTQLSDAGQKIVMGDSSPSTVTLNPAVTPPWFAFIGNDSSAIVSINTDSGATVRGLTSIYPGGMAIVFYDGATFWSEGVAIATDSSLGVVQPDGVTITVDSSGVIRANGPAGGDLSGFYPDPTVKGIQTVPVSPGAPTDGQYLQYSAANAEWQPADLPASPSGVLWLDSAASTIAGYLSLIPSFPTTAETTASASGNSGAGQVLVKAFASAPINEISVVGGSWEPKIYASVDSLTQSPSMVLTIFKRTFGGVETQLGTDTVVLTSTATTEYQPSIEIASFSTNPTDVIVFKVFLLAGGGSTRTLTIYFDGTTHASHLNVPIPSVNVIKSEPVYTVQTGAYTFLDSNRGYLIPFNSASALAASLPQAGASSQFMNGWFCDVINVGAGIVTITPTTSTINLRPAIAVDSGAGGRIVSDGTNYYFV